MRIKLYADGINKSKVTIDHNGHELLWDVNVFDKSNFAGEFDMFQYNNMYWSKKSEEEQNQIFNIFKNIREVFDHTNDWKKLSQSLQPLISELLEHHDLQQVQTWILFHTDIQFPADLKTEYVPSNDKTGSREQTYILSDYQKLIALTFCLRLMIPIWGEFIMRTRQDTGTEFKEYQAFLLLSKTKLYQSEAMDKLRTYVEHSIPDERSSSTILGGISTEDFPIWILSLVIIRRLCTNDIRGYQPDYSIIPFIYNHVKERVRRCDNSFNGMVKDKKVVDSGGDSEGRASVLEGYKIKQEIPSGDVVLVEESLSDIVAVTKVLCPDIDENLLLNSLHTSSVLLTKNLEKPQITLAQWIFKPYTPPRGLRLLSKKTTVAVLGATQAILWHRGHHVLAGLATATVSQNDDDSVSSIESRARITKELLAELNLYYPYTQRTPPRQRNSKPVNLVVEAIDSVCDQLSSFNWVVTADKYFLPYLTGSEANRSIVVPHDIRIKVAQLVVDIAKNSGKTVKTI